MRLTSYDAGAGETFLFEFYAADQTPHAAVLGAVDPSCSVLSFRGSLPWCRTASKDGCVPKPSGFYKDGRLVVLEVAHSDIFWLGTTNDMKLDATQIAAALDLMKQDAGFAWQHEDMIIFRAFLAFYPEREAELIGRIREGRFDIGATFTEPFEETLYNELLIRQVCGSVCVASGLELEVGGSIRTQRNGQCDSRIIKKETADRTEQARNNEMGLSMQKEIQGLE